MATLTPILTATPGNPLTYNVGMAETFSWIPVENDADRPIYARATYLTNVDDIKIQLSASNINVSLDELELNTDNVEELLESTNFTLSAFKFETKEGIDRANTLLEVLTGTQDESVSLLDALTANTDDLEELVQENNALLIGLTAIQVDKQDQVITLLHQLTANTDEIEINTDGIETILNSLTALTESEFNQTQTFLDSLTALAQTEFDETQTILTTKFDSLTAIQVDKQDQVITLLHQLTANTDSLEVNTDDIESLLEVLTAVDFATSANQQQTNTLLDVLTSSNEQIKIDTSSSVTLLSELTSSNIHVAGFNIPPYDEINLEYEGTTDYLRKVSYLESSTEVLALSFAYVTEPPTSSDNRILKVKKL